MTHQTATLKAVLTYAAKLRADGDAIIRRDLYAKPYRPTDEAAKRLAQICGKARVEKLLNANPAATRDEQLAARSLGPSDAIATLSLRFIEAQTTYRAEKVASEQKDNRHRRRQEQHRRDREANLEKVSIGRRIDDALRYLATVSSVSAASLESDIVSGSKDHGIQTSEDGDVWVDDPAKRAKVIAERAMREIEHEAESARRRRVELEAA